MSEISRGSLQLSFGDTQVGHMTESTECRYGVHKLCTESYCNCDCHNKTS